LALPCALDIWIPILLISRSLRLCEVFDTARDERRPARLVACAQALPRVALKVFVKKREAAPVRIKRISLFKTVPSASPALIWKKDAGEARVQFGGDFCEVQQLPGTYGALDAKTVAVKVV
jgi:hypothetical protein